MTQTLAALEHPDEFIHRHIGPDAAQTVAMCAALGVADVDALVAQTVPAAIRLLGPLALGEPQTESAALAALRARAGQNRVLTSLIGLGYHDTLTPTVILRNVLENPGWYTAYTPYQAEIAQGRLEALLNFQQMIIDLTGLPLANASLLDEATAAAETMAMARRVSSAASKVFFVDANVLPQTLDVLRTRAAGYGLELVVDAPEAVARYSVFGAMFQYPDQHGTVRDLREPIAAVQAQGGLAVVAADLLSLVLLTPPGELGADIAVGSAQRFGVPLGFGGPHAAFFATKDAYKRAVPGRIIGVSVDVRGKTAYRMALQTREQHIRREKANSNICTSQVLLANIAGFYAVYHGPAGLQRIASRVARLTAMFACGLQQAGVQVLTRHAFDTVEVAVGAQADALQAAAVAAGYNLRRVDATTLGLSFNETTTRADLTALWAVFAPGQALDIAALDAACIEAGGSLIPPALRRNSPILTHAVFHRYHTETELLRYLKRLENKDLALNHSMIALGSCTMKLNATSEMLPVTWPEFGRIHPFAPLEQAQGYLQIITELEQWLQVITGFDAISMQPNSGAQGEYAGLLAIQQYHASRGEGYRDVCLIPKSAHGTNPATAQMMGMTVVAVECDASGNVDLADLQAKAAAHEARLSCLMLTYPSTHGVFEEAVRTLCDTVHAHGGQVYMDGANLNAQVGLTSPGLIGADVSHMNLHKTFCIPHGGGGPGMGPIGVKAHLAPFLANHVVQPIPGKTPGQTAVSAAPWGSASILTISWMYIAMMGGRGLTEATRYALLNANYLAQRLASHYPVLYTGSQGRVAHECIIDIRPLKASTGISEVDIAKRLMDYGFHAPTMSFPVAGTIMIEPTESESQAELDRLADALIAIRGEIARVESGEWPADNNPLKHAPHTQHEATAAEWSRPYSREQAVYPLPWVRDNKFWPSVNRIDDVYGDRNLFCACAPITDYR